METETALATAQRSDESVRTTPYGDGTRTAKGGKLSRAAATTIKSRAIAKKKRPPQEQQYLKAIKMSSAELGEVIKAPTARIAQHVGNALAHDLEAKNERREAQRVFQENIAFFYEAKQRLLNPGYRTDVDGGKDRTPDENEKNYGAPDWATFQRKCAAYSLQHADRMLKAFARTHGLLTDEGENIDDPDPNDGEGAGRPRGRRTEDATARRRYEFIATAAMEIANRNPEGEVEKQILAAAEHEPAPLMPVPPDVFTEVLSFLTVISSTAADEKVRAEAKQLANKMRLHKPAPAVAVVPAEAAKEEKRKRDKRLARKNGKPLGSAACNAPALGTSEHVQRFEATPPVAEPSVAEAAVEEQEAPGTNDDALGAPEARPPARPQVATPKPARSPRSKKVYEAFPGGPKVLEVAVSGDSGDAPKLKYFVCCGDQSKPYLALDEAKTACDKIARETPGSGAQKRAASTKVKDPAVRDPEKEHEDKTLGVADIQGNESLAEGSVGTLPESTGQSKCRKAKPPTAPSARKKVTAQAEVIANAQPGERQSHPAKPNATVTKPFRVKKRTVGDSIDFAVIRDGDRTPDDVFDSMDEAVSHCETLNAPRVAGIVPPHANRQSAALSAAY